MFKLKEDAPTPIDYSRMKVGSCYIRHIEGGNKIYGSNMLYSCIDYNNHYISFDTHKGIWNFYCTSHDLEKMLFYEIEIITSEITFRFK